MSLVSVVRTAAVIVKPQAQALLVVSRAPEKAQPWRAFWPPKAEDYTAAEKAEMPWLTWKYDPTKPTDRPWREWMLENQKTVARRGGL
ncbi:hypothetical protein COCMIDRAFT_4841 [Bipolaris oryzae ATCC 44560]|uniref:Uncharacterized protein n=1 Tax=Bipolaris oryzae ATCC 44560 TaxID=930090 RepID=W6ZQL8_COCMI|nr:uncharacterized protein COCMIDRAFT_4841 [Bipolaris oryzae ATCC 44560]EUC45996.1 hypothetical protein COCMIDRAFT_4841 [Bipolaris oryzae ATCC 44560]